MDKFFAVLIEDVAFCLRCVKGTTDQRRRRALIRAGFAGTEGCVQYLKQSILDDLSINRQLYTEAAVAMLRDESYTVDSRGKALTQQKFIPLDANIRFMLRMWCRGAVDEELNLEG